MRPWKYVVHAIKVTENLVYVERNARAPKTARFFAVFLVETRLIYLCHYIFKRFCAC